MKLTASQRQYLVDRLVETAELDFLINSFAHIDLEEFAKEYQYELKSLDDNKLTQEYEDCFGKVPFNENLEPPEMDKSQVNLW